MCKREMHLWDECLSGCPGYAAEDHYLVCDACQLMVNIESIDADIANQMLNDQ